MGFDECVKLIKQWDEEKKQRIIINRSRITPAYKNFLEKTVFKDDFNQVIPSYMLNRKLSKLFDFLVNIKASKDAINEIYDILREDLNT